MVNGFSPYSFLVFHLSVHLILNEWLKANVSLCAQRKATNIFQTVLERAFSPETPKKKRSLGGCNLNFVLECKKKLNALQITIF